MEYTYGAFLGRPSAHAHAGKLQLEAHALLLALSPQLVHLRPRLLGALDRLGRLGDLAP